MDERIRVKLWTTVREHRGPIGYAKETSLADVLKQVPLADIKYVGDDASWLPELSGDEHGRSRGPAELAMEVAREGGTLRPGFYHLRKVSPAAMARLTTSSTLAMPLPAAVARAPYSETAAAESAVRRSA
jgi:hypothetical protein